MSKCNGIKNRSTYKMSAGTSAYKAALMAIICLGLGGGMLYAAFSDDNWTVTDTPSWDNLRSKLLDRRIPSVAAENKLVAYGFTLLFFSCFLFFVIGITSGAYAYDGRSKISDVALNELRTEGAKAQEQLI